MVAELGLHTTKAFSAFCTGHAGMEVGPAWEEVGGDTAWTTDQRDIPDDITSHSVHKVRGRRRKGRKFGVITFVFMRSCYCVMGACSPGDG